MEGKGKRLAVALLALSLLGLAVGPGCLRIVVLPSGATPTPQVKFTLVVPQQPFVPATPVPTPVCVSATALLQPTMAPKVTLRVQTPVSVTGTAACPPATCVTATVGGRRDP